MTESTQDFLEKMAFQKLKRLIQEQAGLNCSGYRDEYLKRRFEIRLRATGTNSYGRYNIYLNKHPDEIAKLLNDLTVNYTLFFRDTDVYAFLEKTLFPEIFQAQNTIKIWSAGCASGEEPYSLSILIHKLLGNTLVKYHVSIYASDIDKGALAAALKGSYTARQLINLDKTSLATYFTKDTNDFYTVTDAIKKLVRFEQGDLMTLPKLQNFDVILCRNVMIYFSKEGQQHIHMNFFNALKNGGYFITGKTEILSGEPAEKFKVVNQQTRCYQKPNQ